MEADAACLLLDGPSLDAAINMIVKEEIKDKVTKRMRVHGKEPTAEYKQQKPEQVRAARISVTVWSVYTSVTSRIVYIS